MSRIANVELFPVAIPADASWDLDGSADTIVVRVTDDDGVTGIGECDAPATVVRSFLEMPNAHLWSLNIPRLLIGRDPVEITGLWHAMYDATFWPGRRGLGIHALSAVDTALHDLVAKKINTPVYKLMGGARRASLTPYATIFPGMPNGRTIRHVMQRIGEQFETAIKMGFRAVKMEVLFEDLADDRELVALIKEGRGMLGPDITMMVDFGYRWHDWRAAQWVLDRVEACDIFFAEATLQHDDLLGHAKLADHCATRIGGAEAAATRFECREWIEVGKVDVLQPNINRCGGLTEIRRIAQMAEMYGVQVVPHGWKTGITAACGAHFQASTINAPYFEYLSGRLYDSPLRRDLVDFEPPVRDGRMALPEKPGLGIDLNEAVVKRYLIPRTAEDPKTPPARTAVKPPGKRNRK
ncbi:MAG: mandelate racemase/muconate lactonizing enzyme family protein [Planctomycetes bacterium]|nr:mandelate racemase/muconate lactonizing enzyme family protein [Planctomycetota bacterium]